VRLITDGQKADPPETRRIKMLFNSGGRIVKKIWLVKSTRIDTASRGHSMIPKKLAPGVIRGRYRFSDKHHAQQQAKANTDST
jgi:hypothetical protein